MHWGVTLRPKQSNAAGLRPHGGPPICFGCLLLCLSQQESDARTLHAYLGHRNIKHTVRYTELAPTRFKHFWRNSSAPPLLQETDSGDTLVAKPSYRIATLFARMH